MHETGIVKSLIHEVERAAGYSAGVFEAPKVLSVRVWMGALCPFSESHLYEHFLHERAGTVADHARLTIERGICPIDLTGLGANAQDVVLLSIEVEDLVPRVRVADLNARRPT